MNLIEFAEQVVFATTLEEKLRDPGPSLPDDVRTCGVSVIRNAELVPGRPPGLEFQRGSGGVKPPKDGELESEAARGRLLHFLANHELLATELMALVVLKFPDAPSAFRRGVFATLREEQAHTKMYLRRMKACGIEFGSFPLSGHFWRVVAPMRGPIDFVSHLSLTFEQANLDYSVHYASIFRQMEDHATAAILEKVYRDEIGHVRHGMHWFRQWKDPKQSDWDAYQRSLQFPMSPERARGPRGTFNRKGRREAGLPDDFIDAVELFRQSRGRTPTVFWFDPAAEEELNRPLDSNERRRMHQLGGDLESLLIPMCRRDDVLIVRRMPSDRFRRSLIESGIEIPEFVLFEESDKLAERKLLQLQPWAWTPSSHRLADSFARSIYYPRPVWNESMRDLFRKSWAARQLGSWLVQEPCDCFVSHECSGQFVDSVEAVRAELRRLEQLGHDWALFKADFATSGRWQRRLATHRTLTPEDQDWLESVIQRHTSGVIEPELNRLIDLSFLWYVDAAEGMRFLGWTSPRVNRSRQYVGTRLGGFLESSQTTLKRFLLEQRCSRLYQTKNWLEKWLFPELKKRMFTGYLGVDTMVTRTANGATRIKPVVEVNPRMTMGHVALQLQKRIATKTPAELRIVNARQWRQISPIVEAMPLNCRDRCWVSGVFVLGDVEPAEDNASCSLVPIVAVGEAVNAIDAVVGS